MRTAAAIRRGLIRANYDVDAKAFFDQIARIAPALSARDKAAFNAWFVGLKSDAGNTYARLSRVGWFGNASQLASCVDLIQPSKSWSPAGAIHWAAYQGFTGDVANGSYVSSVDNIGDTLYQKDSASGGGIINQTNGAGASFDQFGSGGAILRCTHGMGSGIISGGICNSSTGASSSAVNYPDRNGFSCVVRSDSTHVTFYRNPTNSNALATNPNSTSAAISATPMYALRRGSTSPILSPDRALMAFWGGSMTGDQVQALYDRSKALANALGCPLS